MLLRIRPNPTGQRATIQLAAEDVCGGDVEILDASGRMIRVLPVDAAHGSGPPFVVWDGRDGAGCLLAPGTYFCRVAGRGRNANAKITILR